MFRRDGWHKMVLMLAAVMLTAALLGGCVAKKQANLPGVAAAPESEPAEPAAAPAEEAAAVPEPESTPEPQMFPFSGKTAAVTGVSDDPALIANSGGETPSGRYVRVDISCMDGTFTGDHMSMVLKSFSLRDENRNTYPVAFSGFAVAGEFDFDSMEFSVIKPVFDVPANIAINTLTLLAPGENEGETIILPLADVPPIQEQSEEKTAATTADAAPQSVAGLSLADAAFSAVTEDGLYAVPYDENIVFIVNNTTDATVQLQGASDHLLSYSCMLTLDAPVGEARLELRLYQNGAQILSDTTNTALQGGENKLEALFKLQEAVSGNYRLELWYNDTLVDVQELAG